MTHESHGMRAFLRGFASIIDMGGLLRQPLPQHTDEEALRSDWQAVMGDFNNAWRNTIPVADDDHDWGDENQEAE